MYNSAKVLSLWQKDRFSERFPNYKTIEEINIFIEHNAYDISLPLTASGISQLNIFEELILRMANFQVTRVERLEELICFKPDFIVFIQNKLVSLDFIEAKTLEITDKGKTYLGELDKQAQKSVNVCGKVFVNLENELSPYVNIDDISYEVSESIKGNYIIINIGTTGDPYTLKGDLIKRKSIKQNDIKSSKSSQQNIRPSSKSIKQNIIKYNKIYHSLSNKKNMQSINLNNNFPVDVSFSGEKIYIHYKLVILQGNVDEVLVSDGFSICDEKLSKYIKDKHQDTVNKLKKRGAINSSEQSTDIKKTKNKYSEISDSLVAPIAVGEGFNFDEVKVKQQDNQDLASKYYSAVEWALFHHLKEINIKDDVINSVKEISKKDRKMVISKIAKSINLAYVNENEYLFDISKQDIQNFQNYSIPVMETVISLAILEAKSNSNSNFYNLIQKNRFLLKFISELKSFRNPTMHGNTKEDILIEYKKIDEFYANTRKIIKLLLPSYIDKNSTNIVSSNVSQNIINADVKLMKYLGEEIYNTLETKNKELLRQIIWAKEKKQAMQYFNFVYVLFENIIKRLNIDLINLVEPDTELTKDLALKKIDSLKKGCSNNFSKVNDTNFNKAINNKNTTLTSCGLLFCLLIDINDENLIKTIDVIDDIISKRAHGNNVNLVLDAKSLDKIDENIFDVIKILGGI